MADYLAFFQSLLVLSFGAFVLLAGLFTTYFGAGKSRKIGLALTLIGLVTLAVFAGITWRFPIFGGGGAWTVEQAAQGLAAVAGAAIGGLAALTLFLVSIMKA